MLAGLAGLQSVAHLDQKRPVEASPRSDGDCRAAPDSAFPCIEKNRQQSLASRLDKQLQGFVLLQAVDRTTRL